MKLLGIGSNAKTKKSDAGGEYLTAIMYLHPWRIDEGKANVCPSATQGCIDVCLNTAGRGAMALVQEARKAKTELFLSNRSLFVDTLKKELKSFETLCSKRGLKPAVRLNGTSDLNWGHMINMSEDFPAIQFYDYTKVVRYVEANKHPNYHLTFSRAETHKDSTLYRVLDHTNVAVVFLTDKLPHVWMSHRVVDGDITDLRFLDCDKDDRVIVGLRAKGRATKDRSGFTVILKGDSHLQTDLFL